ncbi:hypothetical protein ACFS5J_06795 [Flavobacterium chuncheonense]|uniref:Uncharacterized protein n=1 Tax=Flavobacterium chuncheonense TaxID=2026653 RepID=A0ABW5YMT0_9FLAO
MTETIGKVILCYNIAEKHKEAKDALLDMGYFDDFWIFKKEKIYNLTEDTLWHPKKRVSDATKDIKAICNRLDIALLKSVAVLAANEIDAYNGEIHHTNEIVKKEEVLQK